MAEVTDLLDAASRGDPRAADELLSFVYAELKQLAASKLARESPGQTLQPTALVHEAYMRIAAQGHDGQPPKFANRRHFFSVAAEAMRRILIDVARKKQTQKHGGAFERVGIDSGTLAAPGSDDEMIAIHEALDRLGQADAQAAELVKLRYFVGLSIPESAELLGVSSRSADRLWAFARAWLRRAMSE